MLTKIRELGDKCSPMVEKELLERVSYLKILLDEYTSAVVHQKRICELNEILYVKNIGGEDNKEMIPHPLLSYQLY